MTGSKSLFHNLGATALTLVVSTAAWAECTEDGGARFAALIDANTGCANVANTEQLTGCRIDNGIGSCTATDADGNFLFTVDSEVLGDGSLSWELRAGAAVGADFAATGGATQGNACGYFYQFDVFTASQLGFRKSNGQYANITYLDVCTDLADDVAPPPDPEPTVTPICGQIDDVAVTCPADGQESIVCNLELTNEFGEPVPFYGLQDDPDSCCVCNRSEPLPECDPNLTESEGGCPIDAFLDTEVTTHFEFNNDPYYCTTSGGKRKCYAY